VNETNATRMRVNLKATFATAAIVVLVIVAGISLKLSQGDRLRRRVLAHAETLIGEGKSEQAIRHLHRYIELHPDDVAVLEVEARLLADSAMTLDQLRNAAQINDRLLRLVPNSSSSRGTRRRLVELYLRYSDAYRASSTGREMPDLATGELRYRAAESIAEQIVTRDPADPVGYRLLGRATEALAVPGESNALARSMTSFHRALEIDPSDVDSAERLANLYHERLKDKSRADGVLDALVASGRESVPARLARYRCFTRWREQSKAEAELAALDRLAPADVEYQLTAARDALHRGKTDEARRRIDSLPKNARESLPARLVRGMVDLRDRRPNDALDGWRAGLAASSGTDAMLTWWLAYILLQTDQIAEAQPLVKQFSRLMGDETHHQVQFLNALLEAHLDRPVTALSTLERLRGQIDENWRSSLLLAQGQCYETLGNDDRALEAYRAAANADPNDMTPRLAAIRLLELRRTDDVLAYIRREIASNPKEPTLKIALARVLVMRQARQRVAARTWVECDDAIRAAVEVAPDSPIVRMVQADRMAASQDLGGASGLLAEATKLAPRDPAVWISYAFCLDRLGKPQEALRALEAGMAPEAAGDQAVLRIATSRLLTELGRGREGRARLVSGIEQRSVSDRALILEEQGRQLVAQGDYQGARSSLSEWAKLATASPKPKIAALDLALSTDDEAAIHSIVGTLREISGPDDLTWRLSRVIELLRAPKPPPGVEDTAAGEARIILKELSGSAPRLSTIPLLRGALLERQGDLAKAVVEYRQAKDRGLQAALPRLVVALTRLRRVDELAALRTDEHDLRLERLLAQAAEQLGSVPGVEALMNTSASRNLKTADARRAEALGLEAIGKTAEAEAILADLAKESNGQQDPWLALIRFQVKHGRTEEAAITGRKIRELVKTDRPELLNARALALLGELGAADRDFDSAVESHPTDLETLVLAAAYFQETSRPSKAIPLLRRASTVAPSRRGIVRQLATLLAADAKDLESWQNAWNVLGPESSDPDDRLARALVLVRCPVVERRREVIGVLEALRADLTPENAVSVAARDLLARALLDDGQNARAAEVILPAAQRGFNPEALSLYLEAQFRCRDFVALRKQLDRWLKLVPDDRREAQWRVKLIEAEAPVSELAANLERAALERTEDPAARILGIEVFLKIFSLGAVEEARATRLADRFVAKDAGLSWMSARLENRSGRQARAIELSQTAVGAPSATTFDLTEAAKALMTAATSETATGRDREVAYDVLRAALIRAPKDASILIMRGMLAHVQGLFEEETNCYREVIANQPSNPIALNNLAWVLSENLNRPADGLPFVDALIRNAGPSVEPLCTRGVVLLRLGRVEPAIRDLEHARQISPTPVGSYYLACAYAKDGRRQESRRALDDARRSGLKPSSVEASRRAEYEAVLAGADH
jgi:cellulose synthase operon protein C